MVLLGATFNAVVAICVVSLLSFRLPMAMLCQIKYHKILVIKIHLV